MEEFAEREKRVLQLIAEIRDLLNESDVGERKRASALEELKTAIDVEDIAVTQIPREHRHNPRETVKGHKVVLAQLHDKLTRQELLVIKSP